MPENSKAKEQTIGNRTVLDSTFQLSLILKGLDGVLELIGGVYLLLHRLVKMVLIWAVLKDKLWAHPWMVAFL